MTRKPKTIKTMNEVWKRLMDDISEDKWREKDVAEAFNSMLDDLHNNDFFGTEGQLDPRGDHRD